METYDLDASAWRAKRDVTLDAELQDLASALFADSTEGNFVWQQMGGTLAYAADLVPDIADDIVNVDRAMRWGFGWAQGPFEMLDRIGGAGPRRVAASQSTLPQLTPNSSARACLRSWL